MGDVGTPVSKSERSREDAAAVLGVATTDPAMRVFASLGKLDSAPSEFRRPCGDVSYAPNPTRPSLMSTRYACASGSSSTAKATAPAYSNG